MLSMQGLGDYSRNDWYVKGDVTMTNETIKCNYDRGRKFYVDALDNEAVSYTHLDVYKRQQTTTASTRRGTPAAASGRERARKA